MTTPWHLGPMCGFDLETTGKDPETDRVITSAISQIHPGAEPIDYHQLVNPYHPIHPEATEVHGITNERVQAEGVEPAKAITDTIDLLAFCLVGGIPIVGMNLAFDLTLLDREARRYQIHPLGQVMREAVAPDEHRAAGSGIQYIQPVIDIYVIDKYVDQYRPGSKKLEAICQTYEVRHDGAHDALNDVKAACRVAWRIGRLAHAPDRELQRVYGHRKYGGRDIIRRFRQLAEMDLIQLHQAQMVWKADQAAGLQKHLRESGKDPDAVCSTYWPLIPWHDPDAPRVVGHQGKRRPE